MSETEPKSDTEVLNEPELRALERLGRSRVPEIVRELAGRVKRGRSIAAIAAEGSGKEVLYALTAAEHADPDSPALQALVLSPTREGCLRVAGAMHELGMAPGLTAVAWLPWSEGEPSAGGPSGSPPSDRQPPFAQLLAGRPDELLPRVRAGRLGLADLKLLVLDGVTALEETGQWPSVEAILDTLPPDAQKIVVDSGTSDRLAELLKRQLTRAHKWPPELFPREGGDDVGGGAGPGEGRDRLLWSAAGAEEERLEGLANALRWASRAADADRAFVACRDAAVAHRVAHSLAVRGFELSEETDAPGIVVAWGEEEPPPGIVAFYGLPDLDELRHWLGPASQKIVVVGNGELPQLRILARRAGWPLSALPEPVPPAEQDRIGRFRERVRRRARAGDDTPELLVLEPLLEEFGGARTAAAVAGLLREAEARREVERDTTGEGAPARPVESSAGPERPAPAASEEPTRAAKTRQEGVGSARTRLFINAGKRDGVGPGDLVGAITGETDVVGGQIGRIEVKGSFSLVDVDSQVADEVMRKMKGASIKGREVVVRPDRES